MLNYRSRILFISAILVLFFSDYCFCVVDTDTDTDTDTDSELFNASRFAAFSPAVATWYGPPTGPGSGGACGFEDDVAYAPYYGLVSAGNSNLYKFGKGCGTCYQVKCTNNRACSGRLVSVTITDECPGACNDDGIHFDLSGLAFGSLAKRGQAETLRRAGRIDIQYRRVKCSHPWGLTFKIDVGSNSYYMAFSVENENGDGDVGQVELLSPSSRGMWLPMSRSWGATWKADLPGGTRGPYSVRLTSIESKTRVVAYKVIPYNWVPGQHYRSRVNVGSL